MPGPPIVVCKDDTVIVDVINTMATETTSIHFHGPYKIMKIRIYGLKLIFRYIIIEKMLLI